jgi:hypothetical protein
MGLSRGRDALVGVHLTASPMPRVRELAGARTGDADTLERALLKFPAAAIAVLECTGTWQELGPERARLTTSVSAVMRNIRLVRRGQRLGAGQGAARPVCAFCVCGLSWSGRAPWRAPGRVDVGPGQRRERGCQQHRS